MDGTPHRVRLPSPGRTGRIDTFWVDAGRCLIHRAYVRGAWHEPESLGGALASAPAATAWAVDQLQVFAVFADGAALEPLLGRHVAGTPGSRSVAS